MGRLIFEAVIILVVAVVGASWLGWLGKKKFKHIENNLWKSYTGASTPTEAIDKCKIPVALNEQDRAIAYLERVIDRMINKARGILPFNSILLTLLVFMGNHLSTLRFPAFLDVLDRFTTVQDVFALTLASLLLSSTILLFMFLVKWGKASDYKTLGVEFSRTAKIIRWRSAYLECSVILALIGLLGIAVLSASILS